MKVLTQVRSSLNFLKFGFQFIIFMCASTVYRLLIMLIYKSPAWAQSGTQAAQLHSYLKLWAFSESDVAHLYEPTVWKK